MTGRRPRGRQRQGRRVHQPHEPAGVEGAEHFASRAGRILGAGISAEYEPNQIQLWPVTSGEGGNGPQEPA